MEGIRRVLLGSGSPLAMMLLLQACAVLVMLPEASATRWTVGANMGWTTDFNYSTWTKGKNFYNGDWLWHQMNVLEVNKTDYETCNYDHPLRNWTTGAGRDVVPLNATHSYYFVSGRGFCYGGMKMAIHVEDPSPPPVAAQRKDGGATTRSSLRLDSGLSVIGAAWDAFIHHVR